MKLRRLENQKVGGVLRYADGRRSPACGTYAPE